MNFQEAIVYILVIGAVVFLGLKYIKPAFAKNKKDNCGKDCNCP